MFNAYSTFHLKVNVQLFTYLYIAMLASADSGAVLLTKPLLHFGPIWTFFCHITTGVLVHSARWCQPNVMTLYHRLWPEIHAVKCSALQVCACYKCYQSDKYWQYCSTMMPMILSTIGIVTVLSNYYLCGNNCFCWEREINPRKKKIFFWDPAQIQIRSRSVEIH